MFRFLRTFTSDCEEIKSHRHNLDEANETQKAGEVTKSTKKKKSVKAVAEDPLSCVNPACADKLSFFKQAMEQELRKDKIVDNSASTDSLDSSVNTTEETNEIECPLDRAELGRSTWNLLHTLAAYYPENPSSEQKTHATNLLEAIAQLYPCQYCASEFQESIAQNPPK